MQSKEYPSILIGNKSKYSMKKEKTRSSKALHTVGVLLCAADVQNNIEKAIHLCPRARHAMPRTRHVHPREKTTL